MNKSKGIFAVAACLIFSFAAARPSAAQTNCAANQNVAVECFVGNAITTKLTTLRYGMTLAQFKTYGVAVSQILQTHQTYLVLAGLASAVADAMPPTNANGSANQSAQDIAVSQIVTAAETAGLVPAPSGTSSQDLQWFTLDLVTAMNDNGGVMQMLTPGIGLRIIDSYVVSNTSKGSVNWTQVNASLSTAVQNFISAGLMKVPAGVSATAVKTFAESIAKATYAYRIATNRTAL